MGSSLDRTSIFKLEETINKSLLGKLFGEEIPNHLRTWVSVAVKKCGTVVPKLDEMVDLNYRASTYECSHLIDSLKGGESFDLVCHSKTMKDGRDQSRRLKAEIANSVLKKDSEWIN